MGGGDQADQAEGIDEDADGEGPDGDGEGGFGFHWLRVQFGQGVGGTGKMGLPWQAAQVAPSIWPFRQESQRSWVISPEPSHQGHWPLAKIWPARSRLLRAALVRGWDMGGNAERLKG